MNSLGYSVRSSLERSAVHRSRIASGALRTLTLSASLVVFSACASGPKPVALTQAESQTSNPEVQRAAQLVPQSFAHAKQLLEQAEDAYDSGDLEAARVLAQHGMAALQQTIVMGRIAQAQARVAKAKEDIAKTQLALADLQKQQQELEASAKALELKVKVVRDAEPRESVDKASPAREAARRKAARSIVESARLLCMAVRLLESKHTEADAALQSLQALQDKLAQGPSPTPIDQAMELRTQCLSQLNQLRRKVRQQAPGQDPADELLEQISRAFPDHSIVRDDRGIVVTTFDLFSSKLHFSTRGQELLQKLSLVAKQHPNFPLMVVLHDRHPTSERVSLLKTELDRLGQPKALVHDAGVNLPPRIAKVAGSRSPRERVEFVFVVP